MTCCEIHNGIYKKGNLDGQVCIGLRQAVNFSHFTRYRDDCIVGQVVNGECHTYQCNDYPPIALLIVLFFLVELNLKLWLDFSNLSLCG